MTNNSSFSRRFWKLPPDEKGVEDKSREHEMHTTFGEWSANVWECAACRSAYYKKLKEQREAEKKLADRKAQIERWARARAALNTVR